MTTSGTPSLVSETPDAPMQAALAELVQLGLVVARVAARLAEVEGLAVEVLAAGAAEAMRGAIGAPASLADAIEAGQLADANDAARDAVTARMASVTESFDRAARAVRRCVALQARLTEGRMGRGSCGYGHDAPSATDGRRAGGRVANDAERAERLDASEWGDEIAGLTDADVLRRVCRDLGVVVEDGAAIPEMARAVVSRVRMGAVRRRGATMAVERVDTG